MDLFKSKDESESVADGFGRAEQCGGEAGGGKNSPEIVGFVFFLRPMRRKFSIFFSLILEGSIFWAGS